LLILSNPSDLLNRSNGFIDRREVIFPASKPVILLFLLVGLLAGSPLTAQHINQPYYCELRGSVFIEEYPERADLLIYEEDSEAFADMLVFETDNALFADRPGIWYFVNDRAFADFTVYFVDSRNNADFSVYFTAFESFAGCNN
jgi:hypothetical protein